MRRTLVPALVVAALALAGCGGSSGTSGASSAASPAADSSASASAPATSASASASSSPSESSTTSTTAEVKDPCDVLSTDDIVKLTGVKVKKGTTDKVSGYKQCSWSPSSTTASNAAFFTAQEGPTQGASLDDALSEVKKTLDGKVSSTTVKGADDARYVTATKSGVEIIDVLCVRDEVIYQVLAAAPKNASTHKDGVHKIAEKLVAA